MLLHCKRDELRKLWIEGIEHKHVLQLLDEIESIKQVPQRLEAYMASKHYLHATDMLVRICLQAPLSRSHSFVERKEFIICKIWSYKHLLSLLIWCLNQYAAVLPRSKIKSHKHARTHTSVHRVMPLSLMSSRLSPL